MQETLIHKFSQKLLQKSIFPYLMEYLNWRTGQSKEPPKFAPISINLDLTTACNFQCPHCVDIDIINTGKILEWGYVQSLLKDWSGKGLRSVILIGGGEPTIYPHFGDTVKLLKELSLQVGLATNGTQMEKVAEVSHLFESKDWVRLSLDAGTNETFEKVHRPRTKITLDEILAKTKEIKKKNPKIQLGYSFLIIGEGKEVKGVSLVNNIGEISVAAKKAKENGFNYLSLKPFTDPMGARQTTLTEKDLAEITEEIKAAKKLEDENFKVVESINLLCFYDERLKEEIKKMPQTCHLQFFRQIVIPAGIYNCANWRGAEESLVKNNRAELIDSFNAKKICQETICLYSPLNNWIEDLIKSPEKIKELKPIDDFGDYFL